MTKHTNEVNDTNCTADSPMMHATYTICTTLTNTKLGKYTETCLQYHTNVRIARD